MSNVIGNKTASRMARESADLQREQIGKQEALVSKQEAGIAAQQSELAKQATSAARARRRGGLRGLLSTERADAEMGLPMRSTLGSGL